MSAMDMTGQRFGRLTVIKRDGSSNNGRNAAWMCRCDCGGLTRVVGTTLRRGESESCGCLRVEISRAQWARAAGIPYRTLHNRVARGIPLELALEV